MIYKLEQEINKIDHKIIIIIAVIIGTLYYQMMEASLPKESNCSFIATIWTDIIAFITGSIIIIKGVNYNDNFLVFLGLVIIVEHIWQLLPKYSINNIFITS